MLDNEPAPARTGEEVAYDGFMSYSHAADGLLAPRLQSALQRFAKPWWKRRAVRIFRDESSLSANPHLWSSITDALDTSGWFILLLSPDAATSEWVNQEIDYWVTNRDPKKILPVVTDGTFGWTHGDVTGDAVPAALEDVFTEEPRWVDLRWARDEDQLDLKDPRFADAVADIASAIRGIPKDDLASEEVRQHRRTTRTAWAAGMLVTILAIAAIGFGIQSAQNAEEAERQADAAHQNADAEAEAREEADTRRQEAEEARAAADLNARLARARELSGAAITVLEEDPDLATRLLVYATSLVDSNDQPAAVVDALWRAGMANNLVDVIELDEPGYTQISLSPDGSLLAVSLSETEDSGRLDLFDTGSLQPLWEWTPRPGEGVEMPSISPDQRYIAASVVASQDEENPIGRLQILDLDTGEAITTIEYRGCGFPGAPAWSPDADVVALATAWMDCPRAESESARWVELLDTDTWESIRVDELPASRFGSFPRWSDSGELYVFGNHTTHRYIDDFSELIPLEGLTGFGDVSPDGTLLATYGWPDSNDLAISDAGSLEQVDLLPWDAFPRFPAGISFTDDGGSLFVATEGQKTTLFDVDTGFSTLVLPSGRADGVLRDERSGRIYTSHTDGTVQVWNAQSAAFGVNPLEDLGSSPWVNGNAIRNGNGVSSVLHLGDPSVVSFFDQGTGSFIGDSVRAESVALPLASGEFALLTEPGVLVAFDPQTDDRRTLFESDEEFGFHVSLDGTEVAILTRVEEGREVVHEILDENGSVVGAGDHPEMFGLIGFTEDLIVYRSPVDEDFVAIDRTTNVEVWREDSYDVLTGSILTEHGVEVLDRDALVVVDPATWAERRIPHDLERPRGWEFSPGRSRVAIGDEDRLVILDVETGEELQRVPVPGVSDIHWIDEETIVIGTRDGLWASVPLDTTQLLEGARESLRNGFSDAECSLYQIDPCPTLDELKGG